MTISLTQKEAFENRHLGKSQTEIKKMCDVIGVLSVEQLIDQTIPSSIRLERDLELPNPLSEVELLEHLKQIANNNQVFKSFLGHGYFDTETPKVILRNILENPAWYTAYTPYQAEISQGRLEMLFNYQTLITELTELPIANASLLDEATAAAEAMSMFFSLRKNKNKNIFFVEKNVYPQVLDIIIGRAKPLGINVEVFNIESFTPSNAFGVYLQNPDRLGEIRDHSTFIELCHTQDLLVAMGVDLLSLCLYKTPGVMGADVAVGSTQRFGVPMGFGGPHAAFFATKEEFKRQIPGRIIGQSIDAEGQKAYRMALQTREQHIKREKATSNICTSQVLLAVMAAAYGVYHGSEGLKNIALKINGLARSFANIIQGLDYRVLNHSFFDTVTLDVNDNLKIRELAEQNGVNLWYHGTEDISVSFDETKTLEDLALLLKIFAEARNENVVLNLKHEVELEISNDLKRTTEYLTQSVFHQYHTEHEMLRYLKHLESKDLSLVHSMISLGSCTMKLNATTEMIPVTWENFGRIHPFSPKNQTNGYYELFENLERWLGEITGFDAVSLQPNSGAQGELAGLMVIHAYHQSRGDGHRRIVLIPQSAHGTNPASAIMAGMHVVVVKTDIHGNIDLDDLKHKVQIHHQDLSCLMVTYPSTHGVFEDNIVEICDIIHQHGGKIYMDGANMNAQTGYTSPGRIGADVCHLNLHKTFSIPHGGGGPGMGPICVKNDLSAFLPTNAVINIGNTSSINGISAAPFGSASILPISYAYIAMLGATGLKKATAYAILNANYIKEKLSGHYPILYTGSQGRCAHEVIIDCRAFKQTTGVEVEDIAKRLIDYGFHAPTVSFPVPGTLMIEPTESENIDELDRFCDALIQIQEEIQKIEEGIYDKSNNPLKNAPHTQRSVISNTWDRDYSRQEAAFPMGHLKFNKFWPSVARIDSAYGDRNLVCSCTPISSYVDEF